MKLYSVEGNKVVKTINGKVMCEFDNVAVCEGTAVFTRGGNVVFNQPAAEVHIPSETAATPAEQAPAPAPAKKPSVVRKLKAK